MRRLAAGFTLLLLAACATPPPPQPVQPKLPLPPPPPLGEPADLVGLSGPQLQALFGKPSFTRKEAGAEMWRYDKGSCRTFFFLYPGTAANEVRHVETVPRGRDMAADANCLALLRGTPTSPAGAPSS
ncbi:MAG TPA: hypothetical protein VMU01_09165 [Rhizomicrobium sp.]|nr:hypothetical protein [Rhizomicrobium sp.]